MDLVLMAREIAREYGVDPDIFVRMIEKESGFNPDAVSKDGAQGLTQIMPETARDPGFGVEPIPEEWMAFDEDTNLRFGAQYLRAMLDKFGGDYALALAAYNAGPGKVEEAGNRIPEIYETTDYVADILGRSFEGPEPMREREEGIASLPGDQRSRFMEVQRALRRLKDKDRRVSPAPTITPVPQRRPERRVDPMARFEGIGSLREFL